MTPHDALIFVAGGLTFVTVTAMGLWGWTRRPPPTDKGS